MYFLLISIISEVDILNLNKNDTKRHEFFIIIIIFLNKEYF